MEPDLLIVVVSGITRKSESIITIIPEIEPTSLILCWWGDMEFAEIPGWKDRRVDFEP